MRPKGLYEHIVKFNSVKEGGKPILKEKEIVQLFTEVKDLLLNPSTYKWSIKKCCAYTMDLNVKPSKVVEFLCYLFGSYFDNHDNEKGRKTAFNFLSQLHSSRKFQSLDYSTKAISLNDDYDFLEFIHEMKSVKKYFNITHDSMVTFIYQNFKTGLSKTTLRRYYFDRKE